MTFLDDLKFLVFVGAITFVVLIGLVGGFSVASKYFDTQQCEVRK
jgi:uncharacterized protein YneF (UPF0154 family)